MGGDKDPAGAHETIKNWMKAQPTGAPGRRQMPQFNLTDAQLDDLADFLAWSSRSNRKVGRRGRPRPTDPKSN